MPFKTNKGTCQKLTNETGLTEFECLKLQAKEINGFCLQPTFMLAPGLKYKADFIVFNSDNSYDVIDVKGVRTKEYITKKKVFEDKYNMKIIEI